MLHNKLDGVLNQIIFGSNFIIQIEYYMITQKIQLDCWVVIIQTLQK